MENPHEADFLAIVELWKGNEISAQNLLRDNIKNKPSCISFNNLGVYYTQYGMIQKSGIIRSAKKLGFRHLAKAAQHGIDWRNYVSIATALLEGNEVPDAYHWFCKAYALNIDACILYNIGVCLFRQSDYQSAVSIFESLCVDNSIHSILENGGQNPYLVLAYCQFRLNNIRGCIDSVQKYREIWAADDRFDVFCLRYLCGLYREALSECRELLDEWYLTNSLLAMVVECMMHTPSFAFPLDETELPVSKYMWHRMWKDRLFRKKQIGKYSYTPPAICMYHFIY